MTKEIVGRIEDGTVIDKIEPDRVIDVINLLRLHGYNEVISIGINLKSEKLGKKGIVKISGRYLNKEEANKLALITPHAVMNIIKNGVVTEKTVLETPSIVEGIVKCPNHSCVTNNEGVTSKFHVRSENPLVIACHWCEKEFSKRVELV